MKKIFYLILVVFLIINCKSKEVNYIEYFVKVNEADSVFRYEKDTLKAIKIYKNVFRKYEPRNQYGKRELEHYIDFCDKFKKNFGGKKTLRKLINLEAPNREFFYGYTILKKYGIDSLEVIKGFNEWEKSLDKVLVDSFKIAFERDQYYRKNYDEKLMLLNDRKNEDLLMWTFKNNTFPTIDKIGKYNGYVYPIPSLTLHLSTSTKKFEYFKEQLYECVKKGYIRPIVYAEFVDRENWLVKKDTNNSIYAAYRSPHTIKDSTQVNRNRRKIGLPSLYHNRDMIKEFEKYLDDMYVKKMRLKPKNINVSN